MSETTETIETQQQLQPVEEQQPVTAESASSEQAPTEEGTAVEPVSSTATVGETSVSSDEKAKEAEIEQPRNKFLANLRISPFLTQSNGDGLGILTASEKAEEPAVQEEEAVAPATEDKKDEEEPVEEKPADDYDDIVLAPNSTMGKRKTYEKSFLLTFQNMPGCQVRPENLPNLEELNAQARAKSGPRGAPSGRGLGRSGSGWGKGGRGQGADRPRGEGRGRPSQPGTGTGGASASQKSWREASGSVPTASSQTGLLSTSDNPNTWQRPKKAEGSEQVLRDVKGILNKLTIEKFAPLSEQLALLLEKVDNADLFKDIIRLVFDKALTEPQFSKMYAELCLKVQPKCPVFKENGRDQNFRRLLLNKCQEEFEKKAKATEELEALEGEARLEKELKIKLRMLGNITFIGELFKLQMLTEKIIHECVIHVLLPPKPALDDLELFCKLMSTIGKTLELKSKNKASNPMEDYFKRIRQMSNDASYPPRTRFMLKDLIDMRKEGWVSAIDDSPKSIEELHKSLEASTNPAPAKEAASQSGRVATRGPAQPQKGRGGATSVAPSSGRGRGKQAPEKGPSNDGWAVVGGGKATTGKTNPRKSGSNVPTASSKGAGQNEWEVAGGKAKAGKAAPAAKGAVRKGESGPQRGGKGQPASGNAGNNRRAGKDGEEENSRGNIFSLLAMDDNDQTGRKKEITPSRPQPSEKKAAPASAAAAKVPSRPSQELYVPSHRRRMAEKPAEPEPEPAKEETQGLSEEALKKLDSLADMLLEEYLMNDDVAEAAECLKDMNEPSYHYKLVEKAVNLAISRKENDRKLLSKLLYDLHTELNLLTPEAVNKGFVEVLKTIEDTDIDIPKASTYLGAVLGQAILDELLPLSFFTSALDDLIASGKALKIATEALRIIVDKTNDEEMVMMYKQSGMDFTKFLKDENKTPEYITSYLQEQIKAPSDVIALFV